MFSDVFDASKSQDVINVAEVSESVRHFRMLNRFKVSQSIARCLKVPKYSPFSSEFSEYRST